MLDEKDEQQLLEEPASLGGESDRVVRDDDPGDRFQHRDRNSEEEVGESEGPCWMEAEISVLVQHRQSLQGHRHLRESVEHVVHHAEQQRANEQGTVGFIFRVHISP